MTLKRTAGGGGGRRGIPGGTMVAGGSGSPLTLGGQVGRALDDGGGESGSWLLLREVRMGTKRKAALEELLIRLKSGRLAAGAVERLVREALAVQADAAEPWLVEWGDLVDQAHALDLVSPQDWRTYARQGIAPIRLRLRPHVQRGDPVPVGIVIGPSRVGSSTPLLIEVGPGPIEVDGRRAFGQWFGDKQIRWPASESDRQGSFAWMYDWGHLVDPHLSDGEHEWRMPVSVTVYDGRDPQAVVLVDVSLSVGGRSAVLPAGRPTVRAIEDESLRAAVERSLQVYHAELDADRGRIRLLFRTVGPPAPLAFDISMRSGEQEWSCFDYAVGAGVHGGGGGEVEVKGFQGERIDVAFRPSAEAAAASFDLAEYWGGEVVIRNVPVTRK